MTHSETGEQVKLLDLPKDSQLPVIRENESSGNCAQYVTMSEK